MDQNGSSFKKMVGRILRKAIGTSERTLVHRAVRTKENLERVTLITVVSAAGTM